jgi:site-specific DNA-methyltransferase (adenine-specific)
MTIDMRLGDCLDVIATLPDACVDAIVTDPPYQQTSLEWDRWVDGWPGAVARILKPGGSMWVFGTLRMFLDRRDEFADWRLAQDIIWEKHNGSSMRTDRFRRVHEQAAQFYRGEWSAVYKGRVVTLDARKRTVTRTLSPAHLGKTGASTFESEEGGPRIMRSVIYARSQHGAAIHKAQKPEAIIEPLIVNCCPPGGVVLDPFGGSGTTAIVAARLGRSAISIEKNPDHFRAAQERLRGDLLSSSIDAGVWT